MVRWTSMRHAKRIASADSEFSSNFSHCYGSIKLNRGTSHDSVGFRRTVDETQE